MSLQSELETGHHSERHDLTAPGPETDWHLWTPPKKQGVNSSIGVVGCCHLSGLLMQRLAAGPYGSSRIGFISALRARKALCHSLVFRSGLADRFAILSFDRLRLPATSDASPGFTPRPVPEPCNLPPWSAAPRPCAPSCWQAPPRPAYAAFSLTCLRATSLPAHPCAMPAGRPNFRR